MAVLVASIGWLMSSATGAQSVPPDPESPAVVTGEVVSAAQGPSTPVARAVVRLENVESRARHSAITATDGGFAFTRVPPGRYLLSASSPGYVTTFYGAQRFHQAGVAVVVTDAQRLDGLQIALQRGGVLAGTVVVESGRPAPGVRVMLYRAGGSVEQPLMPAIIDSDSRFTNVITDGDGGFRFFGLPSGRYTIAAGGLPGTDGAPMSAQTFLPGTLFPTEAAFVDITFGEERTGVDITLRRASGQRISGHVLGTGAEGAELRLEPSGPFHNLAARADGQFTIENVPQGQYVIRARAVVAGPAGIERFAAETPVIVGAAPVTGVLLNMTSPLQTRVAGRVVVEPSHGGAPPRAIVRLRPRDRWYSAHPLEAVVEPDHTFVISDVPPGRYNVEVTFDGEAGPGPTWQVVSFIAGGQDVLDTGLTVADDGIVAATVTVTQSTQELRGVLRGSSTLPPTMLTMLVYPADRRFWTHGSRRIQTTRPATDGSFVFADLPSGDYFAVALFDPDPTAVFDPVYLASLVDVSLRVRLEPGERKVLDVATAP